MMLCGPRISYPTTTEVTEACIDLWLNAGNLAIPRYCRKCDGWHLWAAAMGYGRAAQ